MAYTTHAELPHSDEAEPRVDPAWLLLALTLALLLTGAVWSDHVVDQSQEDWHGNVQVYGPAQRY